LFSIVFVRVSEFIAGDDPAGISFSAWGSKESN
jgi:hypothetical protein